MAVKEATLALSVRDLQPADTTSAAIRAAFFRLKDRRIENHAEIVGLTDARSALLLSAPSAEIDRNDEVLRRRRVFAEQLDALEQELRTSFTTAKEGEEDAEFVAKLEEISAAETTLNEDLRTKYPELARAIVALLNRERALLDAYADVSRMPGASRVPHGDSPRYLARDLQRAWRGPHATPETFGDTVHLPGLHNGQPLWRGKW